MLGEPGWREPAAGARRRQRAHQHGVVSGKGCTGHLAVAGLVAGAYGAARFVA
ncbi:MAG: hypothetical protein ABF535_05910 [Acetobacter sp.]